MSMPAGTAHSCPAEAAAANAHKPPPALPPHSPAPPLRELRSCGPLSPWDGGHGVTQVGGVTVSPLRSPDDQRSQFAVAELASGLRMVLPASIRVASSFVALEQRRWFEAELQFLVELVAEGDAVVDVGASYGFYSLPLAQKVGSGGRVLAFEPDARCAALLRQSAELNGVAEQLQLHVVALADADAGEEATLLFGATPELNALDLSAHGATVVTDEESTQEQLLLGGSRESMQSLEFDPRLAAAKIVVDKGESIKAMVAADSPSAAAEAVNRVSAAGGTVGEAAAAAAAAAPNAPNAPNAPVSAAEAEHHKAEKYRADTLAEMGAKVTALDGRQRAIEMNRKQENREEKRDEISGLITALILQKKALSELSVDDLVKKLGSGEQTEATPPPPPLTETCKVRVSTLDASLAAHPLPHGARLSVIKV